ncbi:sensor domain-containing diguanylate cyclase [Aliidiomarina soli]|uniref:diguanylate cyclase n=1 Tax=Aliidiomarina soli TaxID=1928574 RepID=A0A432WJL9_9GAMM|nr:sensor domain-containing diguanylate cyclase [Aliidiomarina soli]RUO34000.1 hypothetical protein CWE14_06025 [Aliidiomarina soli]
MNSRKGSSDFRFTEHSAEALLEILDNAQLGLWELNLRTGDSQVTPRWADILGYLPEELEPVTFERFLSLLHDDDKASLQAHLDSVQHRQQTGYQMVFRMRHKNNHWRWIKSQGTVSAWDNNTPLMMAGFHLDVTDEVTQSITDSLTGWYTRRHFMQIGSKSVQRAHRQDSRLALIILDIDYFKQINDKYGHATGDKVLIAVTQQLGERLRTTDVAARIGGEEFAILLEGASLFDARNIAETLREQIRQNQFSDPKGSDFSITSSFGVSMLNPDDGTIDDLLSRADQALYRAKANGRDRVELA